MGNAASGVRRIQSAEALFTRQMPGGGCVRVELLVSDRGDIAGERLRGRVIIERTPHLQTADRSVMIVEELEGRDADDVVPELLRIARDNAAIARRVLRRRQTADG